MKPIRILLVDDHALMREGVASMLKDVEFIDIIGKVESGEEAINSAEEQQPDIVLMDIMMGGMTGIEAARWIQEQNNNIKVILLSGELNQELIALSAKVGVHGYLPKNISRAGLVEAIQKVYSGEKAFSPTVMNMVFEQFYQQETKPKKAVTKSKDLTTRETEVLEQVAQGKANQEIADTLFISIKTVETHKTNILSKLGLRNTAELVKYAIKNNIIEL